MVKQDRLHELHEKFHRARRHSARHVVELLIAWRRLDFLGRSGLPDYRLRLDRQAAAKHRDHRVIAVDCRGRVELLPGTIQKPMSLAPEQQLQVLLDIIAVDGGLLPFVAVAEVAAKKLDA